MTRRELIEQAIIAIIDADNHYCIANNEGQACCIDPRPDMWTKAYGGESVKAGLIDRILEICGPQSEGK